MARIIFNTPEDGVAVQPNATVTLCEIDTSKLSRIRIIVYTKISEPTINQTNGVTIIGWFVEGKDTYPVFSNYLDGVKTVNSTEVIDTPSAKMTFTAAGGISGTNLVKLYVYGI
jgi:hypothetical protein